MALKRGGPGAWPAWPGLVSEKKKTKKKREKQPKKQKKSLGRLVVSRRFKEKFYRIGFSGF